ncbi:LamG domain-containing protein [Nonomuraea basaltis]|uniref:LamG domain-containing protein n=1 Tax=Nonomuraea basaltis TaxID=2495887 RepID=UPI001486B6E9|nr:LamG domain-containing protein [Nonomuraea basaltis]
MAVRFDADGESYTRSTGLGAVTVFSFACWVKLAVDRATTTVILQIDNGSGANRLRLNAWNGTALTFQSDGGGWFGTIGHTLVVGEWTYVALSATSNPGQARTAIRAAGSTTFAGGSPSQANITVNAATLRIGDGQAASEWLNGSIAAVKVWDQELTADELQQESWTYMPQRTAGLRGWYPLLTNTTTDLSGSGQTLTGGTDAALDDGPPISWRTGRHRTVFPASGVSGTLAGVLPALTATSSGIVETSGTLAGALPALTANAAGVVESAGALDATLPALTASLTGESDMPAGELLATLPALSASLTGDVTVTGTLDAALPALTGGFTDVKTGDFDFIAAGLSRGWTSPALDPAWAGLDVAAAWAARDITRGWTEDDTSREWTARTPTL